MTDRSGEFAYWIGMHPIEKLQPAELAEINEWYDTVHVPEVVARNPGFTRGRRWQLVDNGPENSANPTISEAPFWLAAYDIADRGAADGYLRRARDGIGVTPPFTPPPPAWKKLKARWRLLWQTIHSAGACENPQRLFLVGMDPMAGATSDERAAFNDFYSDIHVPEVMERLGFESGRRLRCHGVIVHPGDTGPEYCAAYESGERTPADRDLTQARQASEGPPVWQQRRVSWRANYVRLNGTDEGAGGRS